MARVAVKPEFFRWACDRAGLHADQLSRRFPKLHEWQKGETQPTLKQLESFARTTRTPFGYFFLRKPPVERIPIEDFRTIRNQALKRPSPDLLDTIHLCQQRQEWYRNYARLTGERPCPLVGSARHSDDTVAIAADIRDTLAFDLEERKRMRTWEQALRRFSEQADNLGILVMVSGVVGSSNNRRLDPEEFRGFTLADPLAPLVFVNGADTKAAQMFTLAHELAHLWLGESALSNAEARSAPTHVVERWCNSVAAELLVPLAVLEREFHPRHPIDVELSRLASVFKVSTLVILRRIYDAGGMTKERMWELYDAELKRLRSIARSSGGDFYLTTAVRVGKRFARAVVTSTWEGHSSFTEAFGLLGCKKVKTLQELSRSVGVDA